MTSTIISENTAPKAQSLSSVATISNKEIDNHKAFGGTFTTSSLNGVAYIIYNHASDQGVVFYQGNTPGDDDWTDPDEIEMTLSGSMAAASFNKQLYLVYASNTEGVDGGQEVHFRTFDGSAWSEKQAIENAFAGGAIASAGLGDEQLVVVYVAPNGEIMYTLMSSSGDWSEPAAIPNQSILSYTDALAVAEVAGQIILIASNDAPFVVAATFDGQAWGSFEQTTGMPWLFASAAMASGYESLLYTVSLQQEAIGGNFYMKLYSSSDGVSWSKDDDLPGMTYGNVVTTNISGLEYVVFNGSAESTLYFSTLDVSG